MQPYFLAYRFSMQHVFRLSHDDITELDAAVHKATATGKEIAVCVQHLQQLRKTMQPCSGHEATASLHLTPDNKELGKLANALG